MTNTTNYTQAQVDAMIAAAQDAVFDAAVAAKFAAQFNKTEASVRMKASSLGIYTKKGKTTKTGEAVERKEDIVQAIIEATGLDEKVLTGLVEAPKVALQTLRTWLVEQAA